MLIYTFLAILSTKGTEKLNGYEMRFHDEMPHMWENNGSVATSQPEGLEFDSF